MVFFGITYFYLILCALVILTVPQYIQRSFALLSVCGALVLSQYLLSPTEGFEWFIPVLIIKLLVSHLTKEEPFT